MKPKSFEARVLQLEDPRDIARELARTGCEPEGVGIMTKKGALIPVVVRNVPLKAAPLLKQEMLAIGADSAHHKGVASLSVEKTDVVLLATPSQYARLFHKLRMQPFQLSPLSEAVESALNHFSSRRARTLSLANGKKLTLGGRTLVMGVINVTPDSFSDGGEFLDSGAAVRWAQEMLENGADLLDVGGESTRPGATPVQAKEEARRVVPVVRQLARETDAVISVDTRTPSVARACLEAGAHLINDVTGLSSTEMSRVVRKFEAGAIVMHMRGTPTDMQESTAYVDLRGEVYSFLKARTDAAQEAGIGEDQLIVDPGLGFGKSFEGNLDLLAHVGEFRSLGFPVMVGASRKSFLGVLTGGAGPKERLEASLSAAVIAAVKGADIVRVHDVAPTVKALSVADALRPGARGPRRTRGAADP